MRHLQEAEDDKRLAGCGREEYYANQPTTIMQQLLWQCCPGLYRSKRQHNVASGGDGWMDGYAVGETIVHATLKW